LIFLYIKYEQFRLETGRIPSDYISDSPAHRRPKAFLRAKNAFLGKLNPLEVIRQWVADSHERRKDKEYREAAERERLTLENRLLENRVISERIAIARNLGATEDDLAPVLNQLLFKPLMAISEQQNKELVEGVELMEVDEES